MKAIIMAGGQGSRLRPLTCDLPKPLAPLCTKPILLYILDLLSTHHINEATITLGYLGDKIINYFDEPSYKDIQLEFIIEDSPLGTAGSVKKALDDHHEDFLVISGDALCDFDLTKAIAFHKEKGAVATLVTKKVEDPREYGLIHIDDDNQIKGFLEKPGLSHCSSNLANTGVYILSAQVLDFIKPDTFTDFAKDVFPKLLLANLPLYAYEENGYWCDIGDLQNYITCQQDILEQKVKCEIPGTNSMNIYSKSNLPDGLFTIEAPCFIGENVSIGAGTKIFAGSVIGNNVTIGQNCKIKSGIILDGASLADSVTCVLAIVGANVTIEHDSSAYEYSVLGSGSSIGSHVQIADNVKIWVNKSVPDHTEVRSNLQFGRAASILCLEDGISGETNRCITPNLCAKAGASLACLGNGKNIGVACADSLSARAFKQAVISGILSGGGDAWDFGTDIEVQFAFCIEKSQANYGVFIQSGSTTHLKFYDCAGLSLHRSEERNLESLINRGEYKKVPFFQFGKCLELSNYNHMYQIELLMSCESALKNIKVMVKTSNPLIKSLLTDVLEKLGCNTKEGDLHLHISYDGKQLSVYSKKTGYVFADRILSLVSFFELMDGNNIAIPYSAPKMIDELAKKTKNDVLRYYKTPCDDSDKQARSIAARTPLAEDALLLSIKLLHHLQSHSMTLEEALEMIPHIHTRKRVVTTKKNPLLMMNRIRSDSANMGEGIIMDEEDGTVLIRPLKSGKGFMLISESEKAEIAEELCDSFEMRLKEDDDKS